MSTNALDAISTTIPDFYSSLEYLVAPIPVPPISADEVRSETAELRPNSSNDVNNSLQKLTNLVYLLAQRCGSDEQSSTTVTLMQAEIAHLAVLLRRTGVARTADCRSK